MYNQIILLLNIKPGETGLVKKLFLVQFFLGVATSFLFTSSLTLFLSTYEINLLPEVYILAAGLLLVFNYLYARLEERLAPADLLKVIIIFSAASLFIYWFLIELFPNSWLPLMLAVWNMVVYMVVGYGFWGMAAVLFNVRESKRLFSLVGAGDIPAKMLGYFSVSVLVPVIGVMNLIWVSVGAFIITYYLLAKFSRNGTFKVNDPEPGAHHSKTNHQAATDHGSGKTFIETYFYNRLIFYISLWSLLSYCIFSFIDFTFLSEIKLKYQGEHELAAFIGIFFALGRFLAIIIKMVFSSRMIARLGLGNALLVTPVLLLLINGYIFISETTLTTHLYTFGGMVLLSEILRSTLQEPVFFILFQPLNHHLRLKGHLIAKGYTLPFALLGVGLFLTLYLQQAAGISIYYVVRLLTGLLFLWAISVTLIRKEYRRTLVSALKKGYFTGSELFLNDAKVVSALLKKTKSAKPLEVIHALNLLERSGYQDLNGILLAQLETSAPEVKEYVLTRIVHNNIAGALPQIKEQLKTAASIPERVSLIKALFFLDDQPVAGQLAAIQALDRSSQRAALVGMLNRKEAVVTDLVMQELIKLAESEKLDDKLLVCEIVAEARIGNYSRVLPVLLHDSNPKVFNSAIEAAGKVKDYTLFGDVARLAAQNKAYSALAIALLEYGDEVFADKYLQGLQLDPSLKVLFVKTAGKIKGDNSTRFLSKLLTEDDTQVENLLIESIWAKKTNLSAEGIILLEDWLEKKITRCHLKAKYFKQLAYNKKVKLLQAALGSELKQDLETLLKAMALLFDRPQLDRIIQLYRLGDAAKIANAIEMLELILPKKYFQDINYLIELLQDTNKEQTVLVPVKHLITAEEIVQEILLHNKAGCNQWTKAIALYVIPKLQPNSFPAAIFKPIPGPEDVLFRETQDYVLSVLN